MDINSFVIGYKKGKASGGGGGGSLEGFHMVRFFNDDQTTLLYTVFVPTGADVIYAGETPVSTVDEGYTFRGFEPDATNITADLDCYAGYEPFYTLDGASWERISQLSAEGTAENFFAVGDTKTIHIEGTVGTLAVNEDLGVYIIGFDHNEVLEGKGIHFGTFKGADGKDHCLDDSGYNSRYTGGTKYFNMNHWGYSNIGAWIGCDLRYDILGSTDVAPSGYGAAVTSSRVGYEASETCATMPVPDTLMAALPADLRAVMKPMTKYTDGKGNKSNTEANVVATIDYLPLLAEFEVDGKRTYANQYEKNKQMQYDYFKAGNTRLKYGITQLRSKAWWLRSAYYYNNSSFCYINESGGSSQYKIVDTSYCLAPIFKV